MRMDLESHPWLAVALEAPKPERVQGGGVGAGVQLGLDGDVGETWELDPLAPPGRRALAGASSPDGLRD